METINTWMSSFGPLETFLWGIAVVTTVLFLLQFLMTIVGFGVEEFDLEADSDIEGGDVDGFDGDDSHDHTANDGGEGSSTWFVRNLSFRTAISYLLGFSWVSLWLLSLGWVHWTIALIVGNFVGAGFFYVIVMIMKALHGFHSSGNMDMNNAIGVEGVVSVRVQANRKSHGKVSISFDGRLLELEAESDEERDLNRGDKVVVLGLEGERLIVKSLI